MGGISWPSVLQYLPSLLTGFVITIVLTIVVIVIAAVLGILVALGRMSRVRILSIIFGAYVEFMRSTPLLLQLIYIYFALPFLGIRLNPFVSAIAGLSLNYTAYLSEVYRGGIQSVPEGQLEAAKALGMRSHLIMMKIVLPQAIRIVIPSLGNYLISLFKDTSLASALTVRELMFSGQLIAARTFNYFTVYTIIFILYFVAGYPASLLVRYLEKRGRKSSVSKSKTRTPSPIGGTTGEGGQSI